MANDIEKRCDALLAARSKRDEIKAQLDAADAEFKVRQEELAAALREQKVESVEHQGYVLATKSKVAWKVVPEKKEEVVVLLKEHVPELVKESVNSMSLASYLRKKEDDLEKSNPSWWGALKQGLERKESEDLSIRKSRKKK